MIFPVSQRCRRPQDSLRVAGRLSFSRMPFMAIGLLRNMLGWLVLPAISLSGGKRFAKTPSIQLEQRNTHFLQKRKIFEKTFRTLRKKNFRGRRLRRVRPSGTYKTHPAFCKERDHPPPFQDTRQTRASTFVLMNAGTVRAFEGRLGRSLPHAAPPFKRSGRKKVSCVTVAFVH